MRSAEDGTSGQPGKELVPAQELPAALVSAAQELTLFDPLTIRPVEDAGAETQAHFRFQAEVAARFVASILRQDLGVARVVCEHHEDFILEKVKPSHQWELVSVKHRGRDWTFSSLIGEGGIGHLFDRWLMCGGQGRARLCTDGRLGSGGLPSARTFAAACGSRQDATNVEELAVPLAWELISAATRHNLASIPRHPRPPRRAERSMHREKLPEDLVATVKRFISLLTVEHGLPAPNQIRAVNIMHIMMPLISNLGWLGVIAQEGYDRLVAAIEKANRDNDGLPLDCVQAIVSPARTPAAEVIKRRTFDQAKVRDLVNPEASALAVFDPSLPAAAPGSGAGLVRKMQEGRLRHEAINYAQDTRAHWFRYQSATGSDFPDEAGLRELLRCRILEQVIRAKAELLGDPDQFGPRFVARLHRRLEPDLLGTACPGSLDRLHMQGYAYEIANLCGFDFVPYDRGEES
jgi:hypothetical protein